MDVALLGAPDAARAAAAHVGDARHRRLLRLGRAGRRCCTTSVSSRAARDARGRRAVRARGQSVRLFARTARQRGQRRPQPQFSRFRTAAAGQRRVRRRASAAASPRRGRRRRKTRRRSRAYVATHGERAYPGRRHRRSVRISGRPLLWRRSGPRGATVRCARCCAVTARGAGAPRAGSTSTPASARAATAKRSTRVATLPRISRARALVGRRRDVVLRRLVDVGAAHGRHVQRGVRRMPRRASTRASRSNTARCRSPRCCRRCAPTTGCTIIRKRSAALRAAIRQQMRDAFYVDADDWKEQVYAQARDAALKALAHLGPACPRLRRGSPRR